MATYLQLVNATLARLRESSVATVATTTYATLIGKFVNDAKRQVEDAWNWDILAQVLTVTTSSGTSTYTVTSSGLSPRDAIINDTTNRVKLKNVPIQWIIDQQQTTTVSNGIPVYYAWNGNDATDSKIELFPTPAGTYTLKVNVFVPQAVLAADATVLSIPFEAVEIGAYARAITERGEDGGLLSTDAWALYKTILADQIALERGRFVEYDGFVPV